MSNKVSIYDIAEYCNISPASVSYVINGKKKVSEATKKKVYEAIHYLGYHPSSIARALSTGCTKTIGIMLPLKDASIAFNQNPFYVEFIGGIETILAKYDYDIVISIEFNQEKLVNWITNRTVDGIVLIGHHDEEIYKALLDSLIPVVLIDDDSKYSYKFNNVKSNDEIGMYIATHHLIELGHRRIGFVGNKDKYEIDKKRYNGYYKAMTDYNINVKDEYLYQADAVEKDGIRIASEIIEKKNITACVCCGDILAVLIMKTMQEKGYTIPNDLSIVGFDDIQLANLTTPGLTTIKQNIKQKGIEAGNILIDYLENGSTIKKNIDIDTILIKRNSTTKRL